MTKYKFCVGFLMCLACGVVSASDMQKYYDRNEGLLTQVRECSIILNQTSLETGQCLDRNIALIAKKTNELKREFKAEIESLDSSSLDLLDKANEGVKHKKSCQNLYPPPLQKHFINQIKSCQMQIDLHRYFYIYDYSLVFKGGAAQ